MNEIDRRANRNSLLVLVVFAVVLLMGLRVFTLPHASAGQDWCIVRTQPLVAVGESPGLLTLLACASR